jgi:SAM-dependent methyltransferase
MFNALLDRQQNAQEWQKIPWDDPDFSRRMLREHLTQSHDAASRRSTIIEQHVNWIHHVALQEKPSVILDLGCGPGLYTKRLAELGHTCTGIDFSPASIEYARQHSACTYAAGDLREQEFGGGYDLVMMIYGEFNTFSPEDGQRILDKAYDALKPGGLLLLEPHTYEAVQRMGQEESTWYTAESGLFSDEPYICLNEAVFAENDQRAVNRHFVIDAASGKITVYGSTTQAYTITEYRELLKRFDDVTFYPSLTGVVERGDFGTILARKLAHPGGSDWEI